MSGALEKYGDKIGDIYRWYIFLYNLHGKEGCNDKMHDFNPFFIHQKLMKLFALLHENHEIQLLFFSSEIGSFWFGGVEVMDAEWYLLKLFEFDSSSNLK